MTVNESRENIRKKNVFEIFWQNENLEFPNENKIWNFFNKNKTSNFL